MSVEEISESQQLKGAIEQEEAHIALLLHEQLIMEHSSHTLGPQIPYK